MRATVSMNGRARSADVNGDRVLIDGQEFKVSLQKRGDEYLASVDEMQFGARVDNGCVTVDEVRIELAFGPAGAGGRMVETPRVEGTKPKKPVQEAIAGAVVAPMPGKIVTIMVKVGDTVTPGDPILILEAMKMQNEVDSPFSGKVKEVRVREGESVDAHDVLVVVE
jgi:biotin carboxyl carrier protein